MRTKGIENTTLGHVIQETEKKVENIPFAREPKIEFKFLNRKLWKNRGRRVTDLDAVQKNLK